MPANTAATSGATDAPDPNVSDRLAAIFQIEAEETGQPIEGATTHEQIEKGTTGAGAAGAAGSESTAHGATREHSDTTTGREAGGNRAGAAGATDGGAGTGAGSGNAAGEGEGEGELEGKANPFDDERVQSRLAREARKRDRLMRAAGLSDEQIASVHEAEDPVAAAEAMLTQHRTQAAPVASGPQAPAGDGLLGRCTTERQIDEWTKAAKAHIAWCDANAEGTTIKEKDGSERYVSPTEIEKSRRVYETVLLEAPDRRQKVRDAIAQHTQELTRFDSTARELYPTLFDKNSEDYKQLATIGNEDEVIRGFIQRNPNALNDPAVNLLLATYIDGYKARKAKADAKAGAGKPTKELDPAFLRKQPPIAKGAPIVRGSTAEAGRGAGKADLDKTIARVREEGGEESEAELIGALRPSRTSDAALV